MEYLKKLLGINVVYKNMELPLFPNYIHARYEMKGVVLDSCEVVFLYPKCELEQITALKKQIEAIEKTIHLPVVLILKNIQSRMKENLIRNKIPFVVEKKQIYLPFMGCYLQERYDAEMKIKEKILPSSQMLFLYFLYKGAHPLSTSIVAKELHLTPTSISRASKQLEEMGIIHSKKEGASKILFSDISAKELFEENEKFLLDPVKRTVFISKSEVKNELLKSGYEALSFYSMISPPDLKYYATSEISRWEALSTNHLYDQDGQAALQLYRYDPRILSKNRYVDVLSLYLSLREDMDERIEEAREEMLNALWEKICE
ncbi:MAG: hypothetical protein UF329_05410 [Bulleidia sp.]|nr:hypothetical protein [Bulleidia sp.]